MRGEEVTATIGQAGQWLRVTFDAETGRGLVMRGPVTVTRQGHQWRVTDDAIDTPRVFTSRHMSVQPLGFDVATVALEQRNFNGGLRIVSRPDIDAGAFDIVNELPMEQYLPGVLARELFSHWHPETFAAQAVAARSFACYEHLHNRDRRHFDVEDTVRSQAYIGAVDLKSAHEAVQRTGGLVLGYDRWLVPGYYSSCCGGSAAAAVDVMGSNPANALAPLAGRTEPDVCTDAPIYDWTIERQRDVLSRRIAAWGEAQKIDRLAALGTLASIEPSRRRDSGRPIEYRLTDDFGRAVLLSAPRLRYAANYRDEQIKPYDASLGSSFVTARIDEHIVRFEGRGFGHGVGLCQYGAQTLAKQGRGYLDILHWYYPGVSIVKAYDPLHPQRAMVG